MQGMKPQPVACCCKRLFFLLLDYVYLAHSYCCSVYGICVFIIGIQQSSLFLTVFSLSGLYGACCLVMMIAFLILWLQ